jgi:NAD(P)-dependent dehydrogenase (short-subunit alcohol dehydrogenase family)
MLDVVAQRADRFTLLRLEEMIIQGTSAFVTGGQSGLGAALVNELLDRGADRVWTASRHPTKSADPRVVPLELDVRDAAAVLEAAITAADASLVINNAGAYLHTPLLTADLADVREEFETNVIGPLNVARAFAPVLAAHGGGAMLNVHSLLSWLSGADGYSASKAAAWSVTNGLRALLTPAGTLVTGLHVGFMDTPMVASFDGPKADPRDVARSAIDGIASDITQVLADEPSRAAHQLLAGDPTRLAFT